MKEPAIYKVECRCEACDALIVKSKRLLDKKAALKSRHILCAFLFKCECCGMYGLPIIFKMDKTKKWVAWSQTKEKKHV